MTETMTIQGRRYLVASQARGPHWVAWLQPEGESQPSKGLLFVAARREDAEVRAKAAAESEYVLAALTR